MEVNTLSLLNMRCVFYMCILYQANDRMNEWDVGRSIMQEHYFMEMFKNLRSTYGSYHNTITYAIEWKTDVYC